MNNKTNNKREVNLYCAEGIIKLNKMFEKYLNLSLSTIFIKNADDNLKFKKDVLDIHTTDLTEHETEISVCLKTEDSSQWVTKWYKLTSWKAYDIDSWKIVSERTEYKNN